MTNLTRSGARSRQIIDQELRGLIGTDTGDALYAFLDDHPEEAEGLGAILRSLAGTTPTVDDHIALSGLSPRLQEFADRVRVRLLTELAE